MKTITLTLPYPISANRYWATRVIPAAKGRKAMAITYVTPDAKEYREEVAKIARASGITTPYDSRVSMVIALYPHRPLDFKKRMQKLGVNWDDTVQCMDLGNCEKVLSDALNGVIYVDDKWIWEEHKKRMEPDEHGARVVVTITALATEQPQVSMFEEVEA